MERIEAVELCCNDDCPLHVEHSDNSGVWSECLHPSDKAPTLDYNQLAKDGFPIPDDCPLREGPLTLAIPVCEDRKPGKGCPMPSHHPTCDCNGEGGDR